MSVFAAAARASTQGRKSLSINHQFSFLAEFAHICTSFFDDLPARLLIFPSSIHTHFWRTFFATK